MKPRPAPPESIVIVTWTSYGTDDENFCSVHRSMTGARAEIRRTTTAEVLHPWRGKWTRSDAGAWTYTRHPKDEQSEYYHARWHTVEA